MIALTLLSEAYKSGRTSMGIRFRKEVEHGRVPVNIMALADSVGVELNHITEGFITPRESRFLYLGLTGFSPKAEEKIKELSVANLVTPERVGYMVHHGIWTLDEMERILLGSEWPERILLGRVSPAEYHMFYDVVARARDSVLGGFLDRKLRSKEVTDTKGNIVDLEASDRQISIEFDPEFFAKVYTFKEDTPIPWTKQANWVIPAGKRLVAMVRAYDWPDFINNYPRDYIAMQELVKNMQMVIHFSACSCLVTYYHFGPRRDLHGMSRYFQKLPWRSWFVRELNVQLDDDVLQRLFAQEVTRSDILLGGNKKLET